jgi:predicted RNase H-like HicB family nuclease
MMKYTIALKKSKEGYSVSCPGLPGCWSEGKTEKGALENIAIAIKEYLAMAAELATMEGGEARVVEIAI